MTRDHKSRQIGAHPLRPESMMMGFGYDPARSDSLGGTESLAEHPATMTHADVSPEDQVQFGITPGLIRLPVGVEHYTDIIADLEQALAAA